MEYILHLLFLIFYVILYFLDFSISASKSRKIRFVDDDTRDPDEDEKDTRLKFKAPKGVTALQAKMLQMAGQEIPEKKKEAEKRRELHVSVNNLILTVVVFRKNN